MTTVTVPRAPGAQGRVHVLGIRHHGPGSARSVAAALAELRPDAVLIEGPADAGPVLALAVAAGMQPPVALLAYAVDNPADSVFWPFAVFSPEWQALTWALRHGVQVRFCDLPAASVLASRSRPSAPDPVPPDRVTPDPPDGPADPLARLAAAAGYADPERWWDEVIESRVDGGPAEAAFLAITEAMTELRTTTGASAASERAQPSQEERREAYMRTQLRAVLNAGAERVVVVCGAWHAPALSGRLPSAAADARVLRGLPKRKTAITWVPWTHSRLSISSGYGAGVTSPGWYHHLFLHPEQTVTRWLTAVARVLRAEDLPVSSGHVIEAVRLAEALATLRGRGLAGLDEVTDATRSALVDGDEIALALVTSRLVVGEALGGVPAETPTVPLEADLRATARRLRLKFEPGTRDLDLDLRREIDLGRSRLLHRLAYLEIDWGTPGESAVRAKGTFRETWRLTWRPELSVNVIEAAMWGTTVVQAAGARLRDVARRQATSLADLTAAVEHALLGDLPEALPDLLAALDARAAVDLDLEHLTAALPALVRALRYGDVRGTGTGVLAGVTSTVLTRICLGLPQAVTGLDDAGSQALRRSIDEVQTCVGLLEEDAARQRWSAALESVIDRPDVHGLLVGRFVRMLRDGGRLTPAQASTRFSRALSIGSPASAKASWVEGFFAGSGLLLVHDRGLLALLDAWIATLQEQDFVDVLPLLRRTFGQFTVSERRGIGQRIRNGTGPEAGNGAGAGPGSGPQLDHERAARAMATVAELLGVGADG
jgi:hypothetical protein